MTLQRFLAEVLPGLAFDSYEQTVDELRVRLASRAVLHLVFDERRPSQWVTFETLDRPSLGSFLWGRSFRSQLCMDGRHRCSLWLRSHDLTPDLNVGLDVVREHLIEPELDATVRGVYYLISDKYPLEWPLGELAKTFLERLQSDDPLMPVLDGSAA
ncbi:MAG TPA: hypothetical protein VF183_10170 [Acidimicrobiales bacterium]